MITVCGRAEVQEAIAQASQPIVLSFRDVDFDASTPDLTGARTVHEWRFDDAWRKTQTRQRFPIRADIERIVGLAHLLRGERLVIHCNMGINRSASAALILLCTWSAPGTEREQLATLRQIRPQALGNPLMIYLADEVLDRRGHLLAAFLESRHELTGRTPSSWLQALALPAGGEASATWRHVSRWLTPLTRRSAPPDGRASRARRVVSAAHRRTRRSLSSLEGRRRRRRAPSPPRTARAVARNRSD